MAMRETGEEVSARRELEWGKNQEAWALRESIQAPRGARGALSRRK